MWLCYTVAQLTMASIECSPRNVTRSFIEVPHIIRNHSPMVFLCTLAPSWDGNLHEHSRMRNLRIRKIGQWLRFSIAYNSQEILRTYLKAGRPDCPTVS